MIGCPPGQEGDALVFLHPVGHPGIHPHAEHIQADAAVGFHIVQVLDVPGDQGLQVVKGLAVGAEALDEIVAAAGGIVGEGHMVQPGGPGGHLVECPVAPAGIKAQGPVGIFLCLLPHQLGSVSGTEGGEDLVIHLPGLGQGVDGGGHGVGAVAPPRGGVDDENMLGRHELTP